VGKPEDKPPRRLIHRLNDNIKMDLGGIGWGDVNWIDFAHGRKEWKAFVNTVMNLRVPYNIWKFSCSCTFAASQEGLSSMEIVR
jgi:hypothetical protein